MGLKDKIFGVLMNKMMKNMDMNEIQENVKNGKYDVNKMFGIMQNLLGKNVSEQVLNEIRAKAEKGETMGPMDMIKMMKNIDMSQITTKVQNGEVNIQDVKENLSEIIGEEKTAKVMEQAEDFADQEIAAMSEQKKR